MADEAPPLKVIIPTAYVVLPESAYIHRQYVGQLASYVGDRDTGSGFVIRFRVGRDMTEIEVPILEVRRWGYAPKRKAYKIFPQGNKLPD